MSKTDNEFDKAHIWHPYTSMKNPLPCYKVRSCYGVYIELDDSRRLIDGMSSWWCAVHGYNNPILNKAIEDQLKNMSHIMFGGITHQPAIDAAEAVLSLLPEEFDSLFFADSGSVAVEVSLKMALQYWQNSDKKEKTEFITIRRGYHGDTTGAMSVTDPDNGMHHLFKGIIPEHNFVSRPRSRFGEPLQEGDTEELEILLEEKHEKVAAIILEPIVQGAGGMWFYSTEYLVKVKELCEKYNILLIFDEIATGFGRTGKLFAFEHAGIIPDILCIGKALTGGYMTLSATITKRQIAEQIGTLMHGPTFMANPLATAVATASINLLMNSNWQERVQNIELILKERLAPARESELVRDVRVIGAIGVVETTRSVNVEKIQEFFVNNGVWIRPFGTLLYIMPPFIINSSELITLCNILIESLSHEYFE